MNFLEDIEKKEKGKEKNQKNNSQNYGIVFSFSDKKANFNFIKTNSEANLKEDYLSFSKEEKKLFNLIQNSKK
jgi:hypothetical protein